MTRSMRWLEVVWLSWRLVRPQAPAGWQAMRTAPAHRLIVGWDDAVIVCGPGTDAGMDSPQAIEQMVKRWKARGYQGIYWRVDEAMLPERFMTRWNTNVSPGQNYLLERVDQKLREFPVAQDVAVGGGAGRARSLGLVSDHLQQRSAAQQGRASRSLAVREQVRRPTIPKILSVDRAGNKHFMVWEYAYPEARRAKVPEFVQFAGLRLQTLRRLSADRGGADAAGSEARRPVRLQRAGRRGDEEAARRRHSHGSAIRFADPEFDLRDPMVESWRRLRGEYLTQFYRELRQALNEVDPQIQIAVQIPGDRAGTCLGQLALWTGGRGSMKGWSTNWSCRSCWTVTKATGPKPSRGNAAISTVRSRSMRVSASSSVTAASRPPT